MVYSVEVRDEFQIIRHICTMVEVVTVVEEEVTNTPGLRAMRRHTLRN